MAYIRFESAVANTRGAHIGVFGLANGLAHDGRLSPDEMAWWRTNNDWFNTAYCDPSRVDPTLFDRTVHPSVSCWFKITASHLLDRVGGYLELLDRQEVSWIERRSTSPGRVLYEDDVQIVVAP